jgi:transcriptional regulator with XRE-family HTH domain
MPPHRPPDPVRGPARPPLRTVDRPPAEGIGSLLAQLRAERGWSQLRLAEQLCAASGVPTVSRHEISRWERQERVPGPFWLRWLAAVLEAPLDRLVAARGEAPGHRRGRVEARATSVGA